MFATQTVWDKRKRYPNNQYDHTHTLYFLIPFLLTYTHWNSHSSYSLLLLPPLLFYRCGRLWIWMEAAAEGRGIGHACMHTRRTLFFLPVCLCPLMSIFFWLQKGACICPDKTQHSRCLCLWHIDSVLYTFFALNLQPPHPTPPILEFLCVHCCVSKSNFTGH